MPLILPAQSRLNGGAVVVDHKYQCWIRYSGIEVERGMCQGQGFATMVIDWDNESHSMIHWPFLECLCSSFQRYQDNKFLHRLVLSSVSLKHVLIIPPPLISKFSTSSHKSNRYQSNISRNIMFCRILLVIT